MGDRFQDPRQRALEEQRARLEGKDATVIRGRYKGRGGTVERVFLGHGGHVIARFVEDTGRVRFANAERMESTEDDYNPEDGS